MLVKLLGLPDHPLVIFLTVAIFGIVFYFMLAGVSYGVVFGLLGSRLFPKNPPERKEIGSSIRLSMVSIVGNAVLTVPIHMAIAAGHSNIYFDIDEYGYGWLAAQIVLMLAFTETFVYWAHYSLHHVGFLWKYVHSYHHGYKTNTPFVGLAFHPLDSFAQAFPHHIAAFFFPVHVGVYIASVLFITIWAVSIHDRISLVRLPFINYCGHHTIHHWYGDYNHGQYFTFWDRLMKTYRSPALPDPEIPDDVLRPHLALSGSAAPASSTAR